MVLRLTVNGENIELEDCRMLSQALEALGHRGRHFAVAVNGNFVPRNSYASFLLEGGEAVEVLSPMQGG